jgi:hypothetical protein
MIQTSIHVDYQRQLADFINGIEAKLNISGSKSDFLLILDELREKLRPLVTIELDYYRTTIIKLIGKTQKILNTFSALVTKSTTILKNYSGNTNIPGDNQTTLFSENYTKTSFSTSMPIENNESTYFCSISRFHQEPVFPPHLHYQNSRTTILPPLLPENTDVQFSCPYKIGDPPFSAKKGLE